jgi:hypothetical protein
LAEQREATRRDPIERLERACNSIGAVVIGHADELATLPEERRGDLLQRARNARGHLEALERALDGGDS